MTYLYPEIKIGISDMPCNVNKSQIKTLETIAAIIDNVNNEYPCNVFIPVFFKIRNVTSGLFVSFILEYEESRVYRRFDTYFILSPRGQFVKPRFGGTDIVSSSDEIKEFITKTFKFIGDYDES